MDDLIIRSFHGELSDLEERRLRKWCSASPENGAYYRELARLWQLEPAATPPGVSPRRPALDSIVQEAESRRGVAPLSVPTSRVSRRWWRQVAAVAATLLLALGGALRLIVERQPYGPLEAAEFVTGNRETATVTLTDGTIVRLAPNSRLRLPRGREGRDVWLDGRAYFAVESDSVRPFRVYTRAGEAVVLGTRFELRTQENDLRLVVVEGRVALVAGGEKVEVDADEVSHVRDGTSPSVVKIDNAREFLDWPEGILIFRSTPIARVVRELEHHFGIPFVIDERIGERKVTGSFTDETLDEVLTAVCRASDVRCAVVGSQVRIGAAEH